MTDEKKSDPIEIKVHDAIHTMTTTSVKLLITSSFAKDWLKDTIIEGNKENSLATKRREFIYAVCFAESYIFEWVRDNIFAKDIEKLIKFFATDIKNDQIWFKGVKAKWKATQNLTYLDRLQGKSDGKMDFDENKNVIWKDFCDLLKWRNSIIHSNLSVPQSSSPPDLIKSLPTKNEFDKLKTGWATGVVINLVRHFHEAIGIKPPDWFEDTIIKFE